MAIVAGIDEGEEHREASERRQTGQKRALALNESERRANQQRAAQADDNGGPGRDETGRPDLSLEQMFEGRRGIGDRAKDVARRHARGMRQHGGVVEGGIDRRETKGRASRGDRYVQGEIGHRRRPAWTRIFQNLDKPEDEEGARQYRGDHIAVRQQKEQRAQRDAAPAASGIGDRHHKQDQHADPIVPRHHRKFVDEKVGGEDESDQGPRKRRAPDNQPGGRGRDCEREERKRCRAPVRFRGPRAGGDTRAPDVPRHASPEACRSNRRPGLRSTAPELRPAT